MRRIGVLVSTSESDREGQSRVSAFREELQKLGWEEGRNTQIDYRWGALNAVSSQRFAKELAALQPDVILTSNTPTTVAMLQETRIVPDNFRERYRSDRERLGHELPAAGP